MRKQFRENVLKNVQVDIFHSKMSRTAIIHQTFAVAIISTFILYATWLTSQHGKS